MESKKMSQTLTTGIRLLFVDDDEDQQIIFSRLVEKINSSIDVVLSNSPEDTLQLNKIYEYDCIVSDLRFPNKDGIQLLKEIKSKHTIPFILYSGQLNEEIIELALSSGADDVFQKQVGRNGFKLLINKIILLVEHYRIKNKTLQKEIHENKKARI